MKISCKGISKKNIFNPMDVHLSEQTMLLCTVYFTECRHVPGSVQLVHVVTGMKKGHAHRRTGLPRKVMLKQRT